MKNPKSLPFDKSNFSELRYFKRPAKALTLCNLIRAFQ